MYACSCMQKTNKAVNVSSHEGTTMVITKPPIFVDFAEGIKLSL